MAKVVELKDSAKGHLEALAAEIATLIGHAKPGTQVSPTMKSWTSNTQDVNVALTVLQAAGASIDDAVTRLNLVFKANPGEAASESMTHEMGGFCQQMVSSLMLLPSVGASEFMVHFCSASVRAVLHSLKDLVEALLDPLKHAQVNSLTGVVWQACKDLKQAPKTNKLACRRQMMQWSVAIKDTIDEFQEAAKTAKAASETLDCPATSTKDSGGLEEMMGELDMKDQGLDDDDFLNFGGDDMDYSPSELRCVGATVDLLRALRRCLKAANESLNTLDSAEPTARGGTEGAADREANGDERLIRQLGWAQAVVVCLSKANDCAGEIGILLYPPLSGSELSARAEDLERALVEFLRVFEKPEGGENVPSAEAVVSGGQPHLAEIVDKMQVLRAELVRL